MNDHIITTTVPGTNYVAVGTSQATGTNYRSAILSGRSSCCCGGCSTVRKYEVCPGQQNTECLDTSPFWICENRRCGAEPGNEPPGLIRVRQDTQDGYLCFYRTPIVKQIGDLNPDDVFVNTEFSSRFQCVAGGTCSDCHGNLGPCEDTYIVVDPCPTATVSETDRTSLPPFLVAIEFAGEDRCDCTVGVVSFIHVDGNSYSGCYLFDKRNRRVKYPHGTTPIGYSVINTWPLKSTGNCNKTCCDCLPGCSGTSGIVQVVSNCYTPGPNRCEYSSTRNCCCSDEGTGNWSSSGVVLQYGYNFNRACDVLNRIEWDWSVFYTFYRDAGGNIVEYVSPSTLSWKSDLYQFPDGNATRSVLVLPRTFVVSAASGPKCYSPGFGPAPSASVGQIAVQGFNCPCNLNVAQLTNAAGNPDAETHTWTHMEFSECHSGRRTGSATYKQGASANNPCQYSATGTWDAKWVFVPSGKCRGGCGQDISAAIRKRLEIGEGSRTVLPGAPDNSVVGNVINNGCSGCGNGGLILPGFGA